MREVNQNFLAVQDEIFKTVLITAGITEGGETVEEIKEKVLATGVPIASTERDTGGNSRYYEISIGGVVRATYSSEFYDIKDVTYL
jgi:hypothetical protein